jgi:twinkle protein
MDQDARVCVASLEFNPEDWIVRIARQIGQTPIGTATEVFANHVVDWMMEKLWVFGIVGTSKVDRILEVFSYAARRYGIFLFVVDNLQKCGIRDDDWNGQKEFVDRLTDFAKEHRCHVILVHHLNKSEDEKPGSSHRVKGSGGITDMADNVVIWWRNRAKERKIEELTIMGQEIDQQIEKEPDSQWIVEKQRKTGDTPRLNLWFDPRSGQFLGQKGHKSRMYCGWKEVI